MPPKAMPHINVEDHLSESLFIWQTVQANAGHLQPERGKYLERIEGYRDTVLHNLMLVFVLHRKLVDQYDRKRLAKFIDIYPDETACYGPDLLQQLTPTEKKAQKPLAA